MFTALRSLDRNMAGGIMHKEDVETAWARVLVGIKTRYDGLTVQELLSFLKTTHPKNPEVLDKFLAQAKAKTDLGTGWLAVEQ